MKMVADFLNISSGVVIASMIFAVGCTNKPYNLTNTPAYIKSDLDAKVHPATTAEVKRLLLGHWVKFDDQTLITSETSAELYCPEGSWQAKSQRGDIVGRFTIKANVVCVSTASKIEHCRAFAKSPFGIYEAVDPVSGSNRSIVRQQPDDVMPSTCLSGPPQ
jgi:hypothetical protein